MDKNIFDPTEPKQIAARDRIYTMIESRWEELNHIARLSSQGLQDLCNESAHARQSFRFYCQVILTEVETRKIEMGEVWPPNSSDGYPLSPGWHFLSTLVQDPDVPLSANESCKDAARLFVAILEESVKESVGLVESGEKSLADAMTGAMKIVGSKIRAEIKAKTELGVAATEGIVKHLDNWAWVMDKDDVLRSMTRRLNEMVEAEGGFDIDGVVTLQVHLEELRNARNFVDENVENLEDKEESEGKDV